MENTPLIGKLARAAPDPTVMAYLKTILEWEQYNAAILAQANAKLDELSAIDVESWFH